MCFAGRWQVVQGAMYLVEDESKRSTVLIIHSNSRVYEHSFHKGTLREVHLGGAKSKQAARPSSAAIATVHFCREAFNAKAL